MKTATAEKTLCTAENDDFFIRLSSAHYPNLAAEVFIEHIISVDSLAALAHVTPELMEKIIWNKEADFSGSEWISLAKTFLKDYGLGTNYILREQLSFYSLSKKKNRMKFLRLLKQTVAAIRFYDAHQDDLKKSYGEIPFELRYSMNRICTNRKPSEMFSSGYILRSEYRAMADFVQAVTTIKNNPTAAKPRRE